MDERRPSWLSWWTGVALVAALALATACNKGNGEGEHEAAGEAEELATPGEAEQTEEMTPEALGEAVGRRYVQAMTELRDLLAPRSAPDELRPQLEALFERHVQAFVELGHQRWAMDEAQRMAADGRIRNYVFTRAQQEIGSLDFLTEAMNHYRPLDNDLANRISDFNIITQYASFELLQRQEPEEAQRLGVPPE